MMSTSIANDQKANFHCFAKMMLTELALVIFQHNKIFFGQSNFSQFIGTKETFIFYMCKLKLYAWRSAQDMLTIFDIYTCPQ